MFGRLPDDTGRRDAADGREGVVKGDERAGVTIAR
jgi:hypothetical protein